MKKTILGAMVCLTLGASAAVAKVRQVEPGVRPVFNSGTGVMPAGAQETMPRAARQLARDNRIGIGFMPIMFGFFTPLQAPGPDYDIGGIRFNLVYGTCCNFDGLDLGVVGVMKNHANGWLVNLVSVAEGDGLGLHTGGVNWMGGDFKGLQIGLANWADSGDLFQIGLYNGVRDGQGFQIGVINTGDRFQGLQIGVVNVIANSDMSFLPVLNWYF